MKTPHWPVPLGRKPIDLGLERVYALLKRLGSPHQKLPPVIHIAGTNGKGSTIAFLQAIMEAAGYTVHVYTSPHLVDFNERILLAGQPILDNLLTETLDECRIAAKDIEVTFFEGTTVATLLAFSRTPADIVLLETGMGGRLDATNVVAQPALTILTPISMDHSEYLGDTLAKIAAEKAAIIKKNVPCVLGPQHPDVMEVIEKTATEKHAPLIHSKPTNLPLALVGEHQRINAGMAIASAKNLIDFTIAQSAIETGLTNVYWPARLHQLTKGVLVEPLPDGWELWLDGGHNVAAAEMLADQAGNWQDKPLYLITAMREGRDAAEFLAPMKNYAVCCYGVTIPDEPTGQPAEDISVAAFMLGINSSAQPTIQVAIQQAIADSDVPARILICGSLYLAGWVLEENAKQV